MSEKVPQNLKNHGRLDPSFHFVLFAVLVLNLIYSICHLYHVIRTDSFHFASAWAVVLSLAVFILWARVRTYPLKVQDRVIRLEERLRLQALAPVGFQKDLLRLSEDQLIGLRFASDDEVVELARRALEENLSRKQIKEQIKNWRADNWRI
jgi:hypothetical protein